MDKFLKGRHVDGVWQPYGGWCDCKNCRPHKRYKTEERIELDNFIEYRIEQLPTALPGESLEAYRKRNDLKSPDQKTWAVERKPIPRETGPMDPERKARLMKIYERTGEMAPW